MRPRIAINCIYDLVSISFFIYIFHYYWTGEGGPTILALTLIPITLVLFTLQSLRENTLYPSLPPVANYAIAAVYIGISCYVPYYMNTEYEALGTSRVGMWDPADLIWAG